MAGRGGHPGEEGVAEAGADKQPVSPAELRTAGKAKVPRLVNKRLWSYIQKWPGRKESEYSVPVSLFICPWSSVAQAPICLSPVFLLLPASLSFASLSLSLIFYLYLILTVLWTPWLLLPVRNTDFNWPLENLSFLGRISGVPCPWDLPWAQHFDCQFLPLRIN